MRLVGGSGGIAFDAGLEIAGKQRWGGPQTLDLFQKWGPRYGEVWRGAWIYSPSGFPDWPFLVTGFGRGRAAGLPIRLGTTNVITIGDPREQTEEHQPTRDDFKAAADQRRSGIKR